MTAYDPVQAALDQLDNVRHHNGYHTACCPAHDDAHNSLSIRRGRDGEALLKCHAGCSFTKIVAALGMEKRDFFPRREDGAPSRPSPPRAAPPAAAKREASLSPRSTPQPRNTSREANNPGCTLSDYATLKQLPTDELRSYGLSETKYDDAPAVRIVYRDTNGAVGPIRFRTALNKTEASDDRFKWKAGSKLMLYGLWRLDSPEWAVLVEGESDCHTLWHHTMPALGVPGAANWNEQRDAPCLDGSERIYVVIEPDQGGGTLRDRLAQSRIRDRVYLVRLDGFKDVSEMHIADPERFLERWQAALDTAVSLTEEIAREAEEAADAAYRLCTALAHEQDILACFAADVRQAGLTGEDRTAKLVYLAVTSRFLGRPVSIAVKGPSSGGKSYTVECALHFFPADAYYALSAMSDKALAYDEEPLMHRFLVIYEAAGMTGDMATYLMRSLLSEGRVRYVTVEKTRDGLKPRLIEREGPTGLIVTTTAVRLHPENETRLLSLTVTDTKEQTAAILTTLADGAREPVNYERWHALQTWLAGKEHRVTIPYASALARAIPPVAVRLRRDFGTLLSLIKAHAILHQATRDRDAEGQIVATMADYAAVRDLVDDLLSEGVEATVPPAVRETVRAVREQNADTVSLRQIAAQLGIDKGAASRRVQTAIERGYLKNLEERKGRPAQIAADDPMPNDLKLLPEADTLCDGKRCTVAVLSEGITRAAPADVMRRIEEHRSRFAALTPELFRGVIANLLTQDGFSREVIDLALADAPLAQTAD